MAPKNIYRELEMKRFLLVAVIILMVLGTASAQGWGNFQAPAQPIAVEGTLQLQNGQIAINSGTAVYFVPSISRLIGFIDGLREGARVSVEGYVYGNTIHTTKLTIAGRSYDFPDPVTGQGFTNNAPGWRHHGYMAGFHNDCCFAGAPQRQPRRGRW